MVKFTKATVWCASAIVLGFVATGFAQLIDKTLAPNNANEGISKSLMRR